MGLLTMAILILGDLFLPPPGIPLFSILYFGWKYIKIKVKADIYLTYLLFLGIPQIALFAIIKLIAFPFKESFGVLKWIEDKLENLTKGVDYVEHNTKKAVFGAVIFLVLAFSIFQPSLGTLTSAASVLSFSSIQGALITVVLLLVGAFLPIIILATIVSLLKGGIGGGNDSESKLDSMYTTPGASSAADEYRETMESREEMHEARSAVEKGASKAAEAESGGFFDMIKQGLKSIVPENVSSVAGKLGQLNPMASEAAEAGAKKTTKAGLASEGAEMGYEAVEAGEGVALWPLMIFAAVLFLLQVGIIFALFGFFLKIYMPLIGGPIMGALGFSAEYANYGGQAIAPYVPNIDLEPVTLAVQSQVAKLQCFAQGPECFTEWQMNNTQRPGSEEQGEEYDLEATGFEVEQGQTIDVAYQRPWRPLSLSFALENPRQGLKGISAKNVQYRVDINNLKGETVCGTDFLPISFYQGADGTDRTTIPPGDSYVVGVGTDQEKALKEKINLFDCRLLQPGQAKLTRTAELSYMYDYFSQSNLRIRAMSYENYADKELERGYKKSETADTPVKSYINVYAPVIYDEMEDGDRRSRPFEVQIGFQTEDKDVNYRIDPDSVSFTPSRSTEIIEGSCGDFELSSTGRADVQTYELDEGGIEQINRETFDAGKWYTTARSPSVLECTMKLANPDEVSSSGETLIMDVSANYTVIKEGITDDFQVWNTLCSGRDCPFLIPKQELKGQPDWVKDNLLTTCDSSIRPTAVGGCDARSLGLEEGASIEDERSLNEDAWVNGLMGGETINYENINEGDMAIDWNYLIEEEVTDNDRKKAYFSKTGGKPVIGLETSEWEYVNLGEDDLDVDAPPFAIFLTDAGGRDVESRELTWRTVCADLQNNNKKRAISEFASEWEEARYAEEVFFLKPADVKSSCSPNQGWLDEAFDNLVDGEDRRDAYNDATNGCEGVLTLFNSGSYSCFEA